MVWKPCEKCGKNISFLKSPQGHWIPVEVHQCKGALPPIAADPKSTTEALELKSDIAKLSAEVEHMKAVVKKLVSYHSGDL